MIVSSRDYSNVLKKLMETKLKSLDTETTGLKWWDNDRLFSIIISDSFEDYYFNFNNEPDHLGQCAPEEFTLAREQMASFHSLFDDTESTWFIHNAKFDMGMLAKEGLTLRGPVHCTEAVARLLDGRHKSYKLSDCTRRMLKNLRMDSKGKSDVVKAYVNKNGLYKDIHLAGKKEPQKEVYYHKVPFQIMADYALQDGKITRQLGIYQLSKLSDLTAKGHAGFKDSYLREQEITKVCFDMEQHGMPLDEAYTKESLEHFRSKMLDAEMGFIEIAGTPIVDSPKGYKEVFDRMGLPAPGRTAKGNPSFAADALEKVIHPISETIIDYRKARKLMSSYYSTFLYQMSTTGNIHCSIKQNGAAKTQRMSIVNPALQTVPKEHDPNDPWNVRRCFIPPDEYCWFAPDYNQMEYRMMLDMAEELSVIKKILGGLDVHTATAEEMQIESRDAAKTINFLLLYGGGVGILASTLGISLKQAEQLYRRYFNRLRRVTAWRKKTIALAKYRGYIKNWAGGISLVERGFDYKGPNYSIQGGCAIVVKKAMLENAREMRGMKSYLALQLHDELIFAMHRSELDFCPRIIQNMESIYPYKHLPLTAGPAYSWKSWGDKIKGFPVLESETA